MDYNIPIYKNALRTFCGYFVKIKFKNGFSQPCFSGAKYLFLLTCLVNVVSCNRPPRFLLDGQNEIVLRLKEGPETPVGESHG